MAELRILGIAGSLRRDSYNRRLLAAASELLPPGAALVELEGLRELPHFDEDQDSEGEVPAAAQLLRSRIASADGLLLATPEYNGSVPATLRNAVDWASRPRAAAALRGKPVAVVGASTGAFGAVWAQADLRRSLGIAGARVLDRELPVPHAERAFDMRGALADPALAHELRALLDALVAEASRTAAAA